MFHILLGILVGATMPVQTSINTMLRRRLGSPFSATLVSFCVSTVLLLCAIPVVGLPWEKLVVSAFDAPWWAYTGGLCGVFGLVGNILLMTRLGSVQTIIFPVLGQILMGLLIDHFGLMHSDVNPLTLLRVAGAALVLGGVVTVAAARMSGKALPGAQSLAHEEERPSALSLLPWRLLGVAMGMAGAVQVAANGYLGRHAESPLFSSIVSFGGGVMILAAIVLALRLLKGSAPKGDAVPWWSWIGGGISGAIYVFSNVIITGVLGTGTTVIVFLLGMTLGGVLVDHFGLLGARRAAINWVKALGLAAVIAGAALIKGTG